MMTALNIKIIIR